MRGNVDGRYLFFALCVGGGGWGGYVCFPGQRLATMSLHLSRPSLHRWSEGDVRVRGSFWCWVVEGREGVHQGGGKQRQKRPKTAIPVQNEIIMQYKIEGFCIDWLKIT